MIAITEERSDKPTPNGGAYSIIYYQNDAGELVIKDEATQAEIVEFDTNDKPIFRTYMTKPTQGDSSKDLLSR